MFGGYCVYFGVGEVLYYGVGILGVVDDDVWFVVGVFQVYCFGWYGVGDCIVVFGYEYCVDYCV